MSPSHMAAHQGGREPNAPRQIFLFQRSILVRGGIQNPGTVLHLDNTSPSPVGRVWDQATWKCSCNAQPTYCLVRVGEVVETFWQSIHCMHQA
eukprot:Skav219690  [mRNA]  locus=scaffold817:135343:135621:+ [translate_table: standard]